MTNHECNLRTVTVVLVRLVVRGVVRRLRHCFRRSRLRLRARKGVTRRRRARSRARRARLRSLPSGVFFRFSGTHRPIVNREINLKALEMATPLGKHPNILVDTHGA